MKKNKTIGIVSQSHLCRNPRVVKEAISLAKANYNVIIITSIYSKKLFTEDLKLIEGFNISIQIVSDLSQSNFKSLIDRIQKKLGTIVNQYLKIENPYTLGYGINRYMKLCVALAADLYICHQELATYIGTKLIKKGYKVAFDFEDWYAEDLLPKARQERPINLLKKTEAKALTSGLFCYTTSEALAHQLSENYKAKLPYVIYNVFPKLHIEHKHITLNKKLKLFWFSQSIGPGRGLEEFLEILNQINTGLEFHLLGNVSLDYQNFLTISLSKQHHLFFHHLVETSELAKKIATFDIGLAIEKDEPKSRNFTITNKFFQYLQSGLPIITSETAGQLEIFSKNNPGLLIKLKPNQQQLLELEQWLTDEKRLNEAKAKAIELGKIYNWEIEEKKLIHMINHYINEG